MIPCLLAARPWLKDIIQLGLLSWLQWLEDKEQAPSNSVPSLLAGLQRLKNGCARPPHSVPNAPSNEKAVLPRRQAREGLKEAALAAAWNQPKRGCVPSQQPLRTSPSPSWSPSARLPGPSGPAPPLCPMVRSPAAAAAAPPQTPARRERFPSGEELAAQSPAPPSALSAGTSLSIPGRVPDALAGRAESELAPRRSLQCTVAHFSTLASESAIVGTRPETLAAGPRRARCRTRASVNERGPR
jgi:hypothetical protein